MKKPIAWIFTLSLAMASMAWADETKPPDLPSGSDLAPPPLDLGALNTPTPSAQPANTTLAPPPPEAPNATPSASVQEKVAPPPASTPQELGEPSQKGNTSSGSAMESSAGTGGGVTDYFPVVQGSRHSYAYLKGDKKRIVECVSKETKGKGTIRAVFKSSEAGKVYRDKYSLYGNKVEHTAAGNMALKGHFMIQLPKAGSTAHWTMKGGDGLTYSYKASFGKAEAGGKEYPDCVVVEQKASGDKKGHETSYFYYAKDAGLVSVKVYSSPQKLVSSESFDLAEGGSPESPTP